MAETDSGKKKYVIGVATVVTGFVITTYLIPWLRENLFVPCVRATRDGFVWLGHRLASNATIPSWLLWLLIFLSVTSLLLIFARLRWKKTIEPARQASFDWRDFREFVFEGVRWTWRYDSANRISDMFAFCPVCSYRLDEQSESRPDRSVWDKEKFIAIYWCDHCKKRMLARTGSHEDVVIRAGKEVERLVRSGEWMEMMRQQTQAR